MTQLVVRYPRVYWPGSIYTGVKLMARALSLAVLLFAAYVLLPLSVLAEEGVHLDLGSSNPGLQHEESTTIDVGGTTKTIDANSVLTPGEFVAASQALAGGQQIQLDANGVAIGGIVETHLFNNLTGLVIPTGVTAVHDFGTAPILSIAGTLNNSGTLQAISSTTSTSLAQIVATNIYNNAGATITSVVGNSVLDLSLTATQSLVNAGTISSSGALNVVSSQITNATTESVMSAVNTATFTTTTLANLGTINSNVGVIIQNIDATVKDVLAVTGGVFKADKLSFINDGGWVKVAVEQLQGDVHVQAGEAAIGSSVGDLNIASMNLTGDPLYYSNGNIDLSGLFTSGSTFATGGEDFVVLAGGNITAVNAPTDALVCACNFGGTGGRMNLQAGVTFSVFGLQSAFEGGGGQINCSNCSLNYTVNGVSATGGNIDMPNVSLSTNGNSIVLGASAGSVNAGSVSIGSINASGYGRQDGGGINVSGNSTIETGALTAVGGAAGQDGGSISLQLSSASMHDISVYGDINASAGVSATSAGTRGSIRFNNNSGGDIIVYGEILNDGFSTSFLGGIPRPGGAGEVGGGGGSGSAPVTCVGGSLPGGVTITGGGCALNQPLPVIALAPSVSLGASTGSVSSTTSAASQNVITVVSSGSGLPSLNISGFSSASALAQNATAIIQTKEGKGVRIMTPDEEADETRTGNSVGDIGNMQSGGKLVFGAQDLANDDLIPADGSGEIVVGGKISQQTTGQPKKTWEKNDNWEQEILIGGVPVRLGGTRAGSGVRRNYLASASMSVMLSGDEFMLQKNSRFNHDEGDEHNIFLSEGSIFANPKTDSVVHTGTADIYLSEGAMAGIETTNGLTRIKAISQGSKVTVVAGKHRMDINAGEEILVTNHRPTKQEVFPLDGVGRRQIIAYALDEQTTAVLGEFAVATYLRNADVVADLRNPHPTNRFAQQMSHRVLKASAALDMVTRTHGRFFIPPKQTAVVPDWIFKNGKWPAALCLAKNEIE